MHRCAYAHREKILPVHTYIYIYIHTHIEYIYIYLYTCSKNQRRSGIVRPRRLDLKLCKVRDPESSAVRIRRLLCSSFLDMTAFLLGVKLYYPKRNYIGVSQVEPMGVVLDQQAGPELVLFVSSVCTCDIGRILVA